MRLKGAKAVHYESGPNMTPLVDVVMVILIFLMLTGSFGGQEHYLISNMPVTAAGVGGSSDEIKEEVALDIRVDSPTPDRFVATAGRIQADTTEKLTAQLIAMKKQFNEAGTPDDKIQVKISPGRNVKYRFLVQCYEAALRAELPRVGFATAH
ncbi:MAG TPA: biopolymer transporter ExbD [Tepidisphaeraceae bacterium]|jgi:biopolymer transport protein ExbD|nr:biopolymer transporter ExbD [Tepidisphaeraceae bacterium]